MSGWFGGFVSEILMFQWDFCKNQHHYFLDWKGDIPAYRILAGWKIWSFMWPQKDEKSWFLLKKEKKEKLQNINIWVPCINAEVDISQQNRKISVIKTQEHSRHQGSPHSDAVPPHERHISLFAKKTPFVKKRKRLSYYTKQSRRQGRNRLK